MSSITYAVDAVPPLRTTWLNALQHISLSAVTLIFPRIVAQAAGADPETVTRYVSLAMVAMGIGTLIKQHQREWAIDNGLSAITWTFDPLVRRNAWFNIAHLGAEAVEFHENFYGPLNDDINGDDETDRLLARWDIRPSQRQPAPNALSLLIPTPPDIVTLRTTDPEAARQWRRTMREQLSGALVTHEMCSFTSDGSYVLSLKGK